jgi:hypothetical protein
MVVRIHQGQLGLALPLYQLLQLMHLTLLMDHQWAFAIVRGPYRDDCVARCRISFASATKLRLTIESSGRCHREPRGVNVVKQSMSRSAPQFTTSCRRHGTPAASAA